MKGSTLWFDLETGGVKDEHPTIQVAAVVTLGWEEIDSFERKIAFSELACDVTALAVNGYKREVWDPVAVSEAQAAREFADFIRRHADHTMKSARTGRSFKAARMGGHNVAAFDIPRLRRMMDAAGVGWWPGCWWYPLDTYALAIWRFAEQGLAGPENLRLQTLAAHFGIPAQGAEHEALADVRLTVQVAKAMLAGSVTP